MLSKEEILETLKANKYILKKYGVKKIGIFGSSVRNQLKKNSDIDIFVEFEKGKATMKNFIYLAEFLENLFKRKVDILTKAGVENIRIRHIKENIEKEIEYV
ncbi:nucleotidyltransferase family protein [Persephonella sp.]